MKNTRIEIVQLLEKLDGSTPQIVLGFVKELVKMSPATMEGDTKEA